MHGAYRIGRKGLGNRDDPHRIRVSPGGVPNGYGDGGGPCSVMSGNDAGGCNASVRVRPLYQSRPARVQMSTAPTQTKAGARPVNGMVRSSRPAVMVNPMRAPR